MPDAAQRYFEDVEPGDEFDEPWHPTRDLVIAYLSVGNPDAATRADRFTDDEAAAVTITYRLPNMPSSGNIVRLHFTDISSIEGLEVFHIYINDTYKGTYLTGDTSYQAYVYEYSSIGLNAEGMIEIDLVPQSSYYDSWYRASISGIEVMKP